MADNAQPSSEELKKHGDELNAAEKPSIQAGGETSGGSMPEEHGGHERSAAAHLKTETHLHDNHDARQHHVPSNELRQPPQEVSRIGRGNRGNS